MSTKCKTIVPFPIKGQQLLTLGGMVSPYDHGMLAFEQYSSRKPSEAKLNMDEYYRIIIGGNTVHRNRYYKILVDGLDFGCRIWIRDDDIVSAVRRISGMSNIAVTVQDVEGDKVIHLKSTSPEFKEKPESPTLREPTEAQKYCGDSACDSYVGTQYGSEVSSTCGKCGSSSGACSCNTGYTANRVVASPVHVINMRTLKKGNAASGCCVGSNCSVGKECSPGYDSYDGSSPPGLVPIETVLSCVGTDSSNSMDVAGSYPRAVDMSNYFEESEDIGECCDSDSMSEGEEYSCVGMPQLVPLSKCGCKSSTTNTGGSSNLCAIGTRAAELMENAPDDIGADMPELVPIPKCGCSSSKTSSVGSNLCAIGTRAEELANGVGSEPPGLEPIGDCAPDPKNDPRLYERMEEIPKGKEKTTKLLEPIWTPTKIPVDILSRITKSRDTEVEQKMPGLVDIATVDRYQSAVATSKKLTETASSPLSTVNSPHTVSATVKRPSLVDIAPQDDRETTYIFERFISDMPESEKRVPHIFFVMSDRAATEKTLTSTNEYTTIEQSLASNAMNVAARLDYLKLFLSTDPLSVEAILKGVTRPEGITIRVGNPSYITGPQVLSLKLAENKRDIMITGTMSSKTRIDLIREVVVPNKWVFITLTQPFYNN